MKRDIVLIEWEDAAGSPGWTGVDEFITPVPCLTVGFVLKRKKGYICVAQSTNEGQIDALMVIPRSGIKKVTKLGRA